MHIWTHPVLQDTVAPIEIEAAAAIEETLDAVQTERVRPVVRGVEQIARAGHHSRASE
jgi:hypothetical protein